MARNKLEKLWDDIWEGRLFLLNVASQIENKVLDDDARQAFLFAVSNTEAPLENVAELGSFFFGPSDPTVFDSTMCGTEAGKPCPKYLIRVSPMSLILDAVTLLDEAGVRDPDRTADARDELRLLLSKPHPPADDPHFEQYDNEFLSAERLLRETLFPRRMDPAAIHEWEIPNALRDVPLAAASVETGIGVALQEPKDVPKFFSPVVEGCPISASIPRSPDSAGGQRVRDLLGLDGYGATWGPEATVLGFFIVQFDDAEGDVRRPTPFDWTSRARFCGRYGHTGGVAGVMGRTVDLTKILNTPESPFGAREVVQRGRAFNHYPARVLIGYMGRLTPGSTAYDELERTMSEVDIAFVDGLQGHWSRDDVIEIILRGAT